MRASVLPAAQTVRGLAHARRRRISFVKVLNDNFTFKIGISADSTDRELNFRVNVHFDFNCEDAHVWERVKDHSFCGDDLVNFARLRARR